MLREPEIILFQNRKNKIICGPKILGKRIKNGRFVFVFFSITFHAFLQSQMVIQLSKAILSPWFPLAPGPGFAAYAARRVLVRYERPKTPFHLPPSVT